MAYAEAVREEIADIFAAGADIVQLDEPLHAGQPEGRQDAARRAQRGARGCGCTMGRRCLKGDAAIIHERPAGYSFLPQFKNCTCNQISMREA